MLSHCVSESTLSYHHSQGALHAKLVFVFFIWKWKIFKTVHQQVVYDYNEYIPGIPFYNFVEENLSLALILSLVHVHTLSLT